MNDIKCLKLKTKLGKTGAMNDMIDENKYWRTLAADNIKPLMDVKKTYLRAQGYTGSVNDMEKQYWNAK